MGFISEKVNRWNDGTKGPKKSDWILGLIVVLVATFGFGFMHDFSLTMRQSLLFDSCLFNGKVFRFYSIVNHEALLGHFEGWPNTLLSGANYSIINYASLGILSLPLYAIDKLFKLSIPIIAYEMYMKCIYIVMWVYMLKITVDICDLLGYNEVKKKWTVFLFGTAPVLLFSSLMITHLDIFSLFFLMLGLRGLLKGNMKSEFVFFMLAASFKPFVLFGIIPLILLQEKRIFRIVGEVVSCCLGIVLQAGIYHFDPGYARVKEYMESKYQFWDKFFGFGYELERYMYKASISFFFIAFIIICVVAYYKKKTKDSYYVFALPFMVWCSFILFVQWNPNWLLLIMPFLIFMLVNNSRFKLFSIIHTVFNAMILIVCAFGWETFYDQSMVNGGLLSVITGRVSNGAKSIAKIADGKLPIPKDFYTTLLSASLICFMVLVFVDMIKKRQGSYKEDTVYERGVIWLAILPLVGYMLYGFMSLFL